MLCFYLTSVKTTRSLWGSDSPLSHRSLALIKGKASLIRNDVFPVSPLLSSLRALSYPMNHLLLNPAGVHAVCLGIESLKFTRCPLKIGTTLESLQSRRTKRACHDSSRSSDNDSMIAPASVFHVNTLGFCFVAQETSAHSL